MRGLQTRSQSGLHRETLSQILKRWTGVVWKWKGSLNDTPKGTFLSYPVILVNLPTADGMQREINQGVWQQSSRSRYAYPPDVKVQSHHSQAECSSHQDCPWLRMELTVGLGRRLSGLSSTKAKTRVWSKYMYVSFYSFFGIQDILCYWKTLILYDDLFLMKIQRQLETLGFHLFNMTTFVMLDECVFAVILCRIFVGQHEVHVLTVGVLDSCFPQNRALSLKWVSLESSSFLLYNFLFSNFYFWYYIYLHYFPLPFSSQCTPLLCFKFKFMASFSFVVDRYIDVDIDICLCIHIYIHIFLHTQVQPAQSI